MDLPLRGFNKHRSPTKHVAYFAQKRWLHFSPKEEAASAYDVINKKQIIKSE